MNFMEKVKSVFTKYFPVLIFILPLFQFFIAYSYQHSLVTASPTAQAFNRAAYRDIYIGVIRQGLLGHWTTAISYTTSPTPRIFGFNFYFIVLGQLDRLLHIDPVDLLHLSQYLMGPLLFLATFFAVKKLLPKTISYLAYFFILMIETGFYIPEMFTKPFGTWLPSFDWQQQLMERHFGLPHHTLGKAIGAVFATLCILSVEKLERKRLLILAVLSTVGGFLLPPYFFVFFVSVGIPLGVLSLFRKKLVPYVVTMLIAGVPFALVSLFLKAQFAVIPALAHYTDTEKSWWDNTDTLIRYGSSLLFYYPFLLLGFLALIAHWRKLSGATKRLFFLCVCWLVIPAVLIPISSKPWFPFANARLTDGYQYFPAGILSAIGIWGILELFRPKIRLFVTTLIVVLIVFVSGGATYFMVKNFFSIHSMPWTNFYPYKNTWAAVDFLKTVPKGSGVLTLQYDGEMIPAYADVRIYVATSGLTWPHFEGRMYFAKLFFSGKMRDEEAKQFLTEQDIQYIFYGQDEKRFTETTDLYPNILKQVYKNDLVTIFSPR